jgi:hypothetical protein
VGVGDGESSEVLRLSRLAAGLPQPGIGRLLARFGRIGLASSERSPLDVHRLLDFTDHDFTHLLA